MRNLIFYIGVLFLVGIPLTGYSDDSAFFGDGADVYPLQHNDIQLVSEIITIKDSCAEKDYKTLEKEGHSYRWSYHVKMIFKNHGTDTTVQMGFPLYRDQGEGDIIEPNPKFRTWVNGAEVPITKKNAIPHPLKKARFSDTVYTYNVFFKSGETKTIVHTYNLSGWFDVVFHWKVGYVLQTGALWKGPIEDLKIVFIAANKTGSWDINCTSPREHTAKSIPTGIELRWHYQNIKPTFNLRIEGGGPNWYYMIEEAKENSIIDFIETYTPDKWVKSCSLRLLINQAFAHYGYPFKHPVYRSKFYFEGSPYKEDPKFSMSKIPKEIRDKLDKLGKIEEERRKAEEQQEE